MKEVVLVAIKLSWISLGKECQGPLKVCPESLRHVHTDVSRTHTHTHTLNMLMLFLLPVLHTETSFLRIICF